jgi:hypothetical protein
MKAILASLTLLMAASAFAEDDDYPHPPAPKWETTDDQGLNRVFVQAVGDRLARVRWDDIQFGRKEGAPLEWVRSCVLGVSIGEKVAPRVTRVKVCSFFTVADDEKHWLPEDPHHWEKAEQFPVWECLVVDPPPAHGGIARFPDLARRIYGVPIFVTGKVSPPEIVEIVDRFGLELAAQGAAPGHDKNSPTPVWLNRDGTPMWAALGGIGIEDMKSSRRVATLQLIMSPGDDTEGFPFWLEQITHEWRPVDGFAEFLPWN